VLAVTTGKDPGVPDSNEDAWAQHSSGNGVIVLDGATESFAARRWARLLAAAWASGEQGWLQSAQAQYARSMQGVSLTWAQEAAAERGSFATVAAIRGTDQGIDATCVGDTCLFLVAGDRLVESHPLTSADQFTSAPVALPSDPAGLDAAVELLRDQRRTLPVPAHGLEAWLATDAVAAWLIDADETARNDRVRAVREVTGDQDFTALVARERAAGRMKTDDSTLVRVALEAQP